MLITSIFRKHILSLGAYEKHILIFTPFFLKKTIRLVCIKLRIASECVICKILTQLGHHHNKAMTIGEGVYALALLPLQTYPLNECCVFII